MGRCEVHIPGVCRGAMASVHHRAKKGQGGSWSPANLLAACGDGTLGCHGYIEANPTWAREEGLWIFTGDGAPDQISAHIRWQNMRGWFVLDDEGMLELDGGLELLQEPIVRELLSIGTF